MAYDSALVHRKIIVAVLLQIVFSVGGDCAQSLAVNKRRGIDTGIFINNKLPMYIGVHHTANNGQ
jgi:hypothetical protein